MSSVAAFLKPTRIKLVFLVEWALFVLIAAATGELETSHQVVVAGYPLLFFYLVACFLAAWSRHVQQIAPSWRLLAFAVGLALLDQAIKTIVTVFVPYQTALPVVRNWLYLAHERNPHGSWIASAANLQPVSALSLIQWGLAIPVLLFSILVHRYYITTHRKSLWADVAFLGIFAGLASWICDMAFRGYIVDFIRFPGLVAFDLKDVLLTLAVGAVFAEALDNPRISWRWQGWRQEGEDLVRLGSNLLRFSVQELRKGRQ